MSDQAKSHLGLPDLGDIVGIHTQIEIRLELQSPADVGLKIENDLAFAHEGEALEEDARSEGQAVRRGLIEPEKTEAGLEHVCPQGVAPEEIQTFLDDALDHPGHLAQASRHPTVEKDHGRIEPSAAR